MPTTRAAASIGACPHATHCGAAGFAADPGRSSDASNSDASSHVDRSITSGASWMRTVRSAPHDARRRPRCEGANLRSWSESRASCAARAGGSAAGLRARRRRCVSTRSCARHLQLGLQPPAVVAGGGETARLDRILGVGDLLPHADLPVERAGCQHRAKLWVRPCESPDRAVVRLPLGGLLTGGVEDADGLIGRAGGHAMARVVVRQVVDVRAPALHRAGAARRRPPRRPPRVTIALA